MQLNKSMLKEYQDRWQLANEFQEMEQRQATVAQNWKQLNAIIRRAAGLGILRKDDEAEVAAVREPGIV